MQFLAAATRQTSERFEGRGSGLVVGGASEDS